MRDLATTPSLLVPDLFVRPLTTTIDVPNASSGGGAPLLKAADKRLGILDSLAACLRDVRDPANVHQRLSEPLTWRA